MKTQTFVIAFVLFCTCWLTAQVGPSGDFYLACCKFDFYEKLSFHSDSTFEYKYAWKLGDESNKGKWQMHGDTVSLFDFRGSSVKTDTLRGQELREPGKTTRRIRFVDVYKNRPYAINFSIDGHCYENMRDTVVILPEQKINQISIYKGVYTVKDPSATSITIYVNPLHMLLKPRLVDKHRFLYRNGTLTPIACDGTLHEWQCMEQVR